MTEQAYKSLQEAREELFKQNQNRLPIEDRCDRGDNFCLNYMDGFSCTKTSGHIGDHVAHGALGYIHLRWQQRERKSDDKVAKEITLYTEREKS